MSLLNRTLPLNLRCQYLSGYRRDQSSFLRLHNTINVRQDVRGFHPLVNVKDVVSGRPLSGSRISYQIFSRSLGSYILYAAAVVPMTFCGALIWQYENVREKKEVQRHVTYWTKPSKPTMKMPSYKYIKKEKLNDLEGLKQQLERKWKLILSHKTLYSIIALNGIIFCCWKVSSIVPVLSHTVVPVLKKYFTCGPGNPAVSLTLSAFSHFHIWHIFFNMFCLDAFGPIVELIYGKEQFVAVYLSAATIASLAHVILKSATGLMIPALGASGAVCAIVASFCYQMPNSKVSFAFLPYSFPAKNALIGLIIFDTVGLLFMPSSPLGHAAHLGGTLFGLAYMKYGRDLIWGTLGKKFLQFYRSIRERS